MIRTTYRAIACAVAAICAAGLSAAPASAASVPIAGTIVAGADGTCTPPTVSGPLVRWRCVGATETYTGDLSSTSDAVFGARGTFNTRSGTARTGGREIFTGCVAGACGTLSWSWHVTFRTVPATQAPISGHGAARITGGTRGLSGAGGSFTIRCGPLPPCTYHGNLVTEV